MKWRNTNIILCNHQVAVLVAVSPATEHSLLPMEGRREGSRRRRRRRRRPRRRRPSSSVRPFPESHGRYLWNKNRLCSKTCGVDIDIED